jgi:hypothetical protein
LATKKAGKKKPEKKKSWTAFSPAVYGDTMVGLIHFSAKTVNSNTPSYGVRLGAQDRIDLPYVALSTMQADAIPADYDKNAGKIATVVAQVSAVIEGKLDDFESVPEADVQTIRAAQPALLTRFALPSSRVGMRLRQVIVQDAAGADIALSPLHSAGFSAVLESRIEAELNARPESEQFRRARGYLGTGGANPQNVGRHVRAMTRPLWFDAPTEDMGIRKAMAMHFRGISLRVPAPILAEFNSWRQALLRAHHGAMPSDLELRSAEVAFLRRMVDAVLERGAQASALLDRYVERLPGATKTAQTLAPLKRGLLDSSLRNRDWKREFATKMQIEIIESKVFVNGAWQSQGIGQLESQRWIGIIEDML